METLFVGRNQIKLEEIDSTNNYAGRVLQQERPPEGTVILAAYQTGGRGQRGNNWISEPGQNLLCSFVLYPVFLRLKDQFLLNKAIALALYRTVDLIVPASFVRIKWPNDILLENRKLAGILLENTVAGSQIVSCVAGIGLNLNQTEFPDQSASEVKDQHPSAISPVSLKQELEVDINPEFVLEMLSKQIELVYLRLKAGNTSSIEQEYQDALWKQGERFDFFVEGNLFPAIVKRVDETGRLVVKSLSDQVEYAFYHGEIEWKRPV